jgi:cysteinyl-tRNA synthetase
VIKLPVLGLGTKVLGGALAGALILSGVQTARLSWTKSELHSAKEVIQRLEGWQGGMVQAIRLASGNAKVTEKTAQAQVQAMGTSLVSLHNALKTSNDAVDRLAEDKRRADEVAAREAKARAAAIRTAEQLRDQLRVQAQKPVAPADVEAEIRRTQDELFEAGL